MAIRTVQKKGGLKSVDNSNKKLENQINDVCLKKDNRLFSKVYILLLLLLLWGNRMDKELKEGTIKFLQYLIDDADVGLLNEVKLACAIDCVSRTEVD